MTQFTYKPTGLSKLAAVTLLHITWLGTFKYSIFFQMYNVNHSAQTWGNVKWFSSQESELKYINQCSAYQNCSHRYSLLDSLFPNTIHTQTFKSLLTSCIVLPRGGICFIAWSWLKLYHITNYDMIGFINALLPWLPSPKDHRVAPSLDKTRVWEDPQATWPTLFKSFTIHGIFLYEI